MSADEQAWTDACMRASRAAFMDESSAVFNANLISAAINAELARHGLEIRLVPVATINDRQEAFALSRRIGPTAAREQLRKNDAHSVG